MFLVPPIFWRWVTGFSLAFLLHPFLVNAQIEGLVVERYYISDATDATDTTGGGLPVGSITYRVFVDLAPGSSVREIFGSDQHPLIFRSSSPFFNNKADGKTFGKDFNKNRFLENTVLLDTWLTIGQMSQTGSKTYYGVPKVDDRDGSFVGGVNNDGGSAGVASGLLTNNNPDAGLPLTLSDGIDTMVMSPTTWASDGFIDFVTQTDSTIFGSLVPGNEFVSNAAKLVSSAGISGVIDDKNLVLLGQFTTLGDLRFEYNLLVDQVVNGVVQTIKYVANADSLAPDEVLSPYLKYPFVCGCRDANFLEYSNAFACDHPDSCVTKVRLGCMDRTACNYDSLANYHVPDLCCFPGLCQDRDLSIACPQYSRLLKPVYIYPNPVLENSLAKFWKEKDEELISGITDFSGTIIGEEVRHSGPEGWYYRDIDAGGLSPGIYLFYVLNNQFMTRKLLIISN